MSRTEDIGTLILLAVFLVLAVVVVGLGASGRPGGDDDGAAA